MPCRPPSTADSLTVGQENMAAENTATLDSVTTSGAVELRGHETQVSPHNVRRGQITPTPTRKTRKERRSAACNEDVDREEARTQRTNSVDPREVLLVPSERLERCEMSGVDLAPVDEGSIAFASLACSHTNCDLRSIASGCQSENEKLGDGNNYDLEILHKRDKPVLV